MGIVRRLYIVLFGLFLMFILIFKGILLLLLNQNLIYNSLLLRLQLVLSYILFGILN